LDLKEIKAGPARASPSPAAQSWCPSPAAPLSLLEVWPCSWASAAGIAADVGDANLRNHY